MKAFGRAWNSGARSVLKLSRTIADVDGADLIRTNHVAEALQYRPRAMV